MWVEKQDKTGFVEIHSIQLTPWTSSDYRVKKYDKKTNSFATLQYDEKTNSFVTLTKKEVWNIYEDTTKSLLGTYQSETKAREVLALLKAFISKDFSKININPIKGASVLKDIIGGSLTLMDCVSVIEDHFMFSMPADEPVDEI